MMEMKTVHTNYGFDHTWNDFHYYSYHSVCASRIACVWQRRYDILLNQVTVQLLLC